jgi:hypothetical protein
MPLDSRLYLVRPTDDEFHTAVRRQDSIVLVKGARQTGKTSLLARGLQRARSCGARVLLTDLQSLNASQLATPEAFFLALARWIVLQLDPPVLPPAAWDPEYGPNLNFELFLRRFVLSGEEPIVWGFDEADRLFTCDFGGDVFGLFRSWHNKRSLDPEGPWSRLTMAIAYATEAHLFISDLNQSPFNVGTRLSLGDFTRAQVTELNRRHGAPLRDEAEVERLLLLLGGQPYLTQRGLSAIATGEATLAGLEAAGERETEIYGDHLRRLVASLNRDADLRAALREVVQGRPCPTLEGFYRLRSAGVLAGESAAEARLRCRLYAAYLERRLS